MNRLLTREADSSGVTVYSATYAYDLANNRRTIEEFVADQGTRNLAYAYDDQYRLTQEAWDTTSYDYEYDLAGNRTKLTHTVDGTPSVTDYSYDLLNQLNTATKDATSFTTYAYDLNGNQSTKTVDGSVSTYTWDTLDRLVHVDADGTTIFQADYDYRTRRLTKTEGTDVTYFRYDQGNSFQEVKNGTLDAEFIRGSGMGGGIGSILYKDDTTQEEFFVYNAVGHTVVLSDTAGLTKSSNQYEAFGGITGTSGASENNRLANTKERDASTGLDNHGFRYYDSATGRYISRDPLGYAAGTMLVYAYVSANPVNGIDPLGLEEKGESEVDEIIKKKVRKPRSQEKVANRVPEDSPEGKLNNFKKQLYEHEKVSKKESTLQGAADELKGKSIRATKADGSPYDHVTKVKNAQNGLKKNIEKVKKMLSSASLTSAQRTKLTKVLTEMSKLRDKSFDFVKRGAKSPFVKIVMVTSVLAATEGELRAQGIEDPIALEAAKLEVVNPTPVPVTFPIKMGKVVGHKLHKAHRAGQQETFTTPITDDSTRVKSMFHEPQLEQ